MKYAQRQNQEWELVVVEGQSEGQIVGVITSMWRRIPTAAAKGTTAAGARPAGAPAPATTFTLPRGRWASGPSNAAPPPSSKKDFTELGAAGAARKGAVKGTTAAARKGAGSEGRQKGSGSAPRAQGATATKNPFGVLEEQEDDE